MKKRSLYHRLTITILLLLLCFGMKSATGMHKLVIEVTGVENNNGYIQVGLFNEEKGAFKADYQYSQKKIKAVQGCTLVEFLLPYGTYAAGAFHDENNNDKIDKNIIGIPTEKYGFSGKGRLPNYKNMSFVLAGNKHIVIELK